MGASVSKDGEGGVSEGLGGGATAASGPGGGIARGAAGAGGAVGGVDSTAAAGAGGPPTAVPAPAGTVPTVFRWEHGGNNVYITGTFNGWSRRVPMHRSGNDFVFIAALPRAKHAYKFIVDDEWRFAPDQATVSDTAGNINNFIDLTTFVPDDDATIVPISRRDSIPGIPYGFAVPDDEEYGKEPPLLPPHLRNIILNSASPDPTNLTALPPPQHVTLNHLYCTAIKDGLMVQALTQRYRRKTVTTIFFAVMPISTSLAHNPTAPVNLPPGVLAVLQGNPVIPPEWIPAPGAPVPPPDAPIPFIDPLVVRISEAASHAAATAGGTPGSAGGDRGGDVSGMEEGSGGGPPAGLHTTVP